MRYRMDFMIKKGAGQAEGEPGSGYHPEYGSGYHQDSSEHG